MKKTIAITNSLSIYTMLCTFYPNGNITLYNTWGLIEVAIKIKIKDYDINYLQKRIKELAIAEINLHVLKCDGGEHVMVCIIYDLNSSQNDFI